MREGLAATWEGLANLNCPHRKPMRRSVSSICLCLPGKAGKFRRLFLPNPCRNPRQIPSLAQLPRDRRKLVTSHDAFQYFAQENGFTIYAIEGISSADQPSSKKVAEIVAMIKAQAVKAIFPEAIENPKVLTEITRETGAKIGPELYADGLGLGDAATYEGMMKHNVAAIVDALK